MHHSIKVTYSKSPWLVRSLSNNHFFLLADSRADRWLVVVSGQQLVEELRKLPEAEMSLHESLCQVSRRLLPTPFERLSRRPRFLRWITPLANLSGSTPIMPRSSTPS